MDRLGIQLIDFVPDVRVRYDRFGRIAGGLVIGPVLRQNQALLLTLHPGELKDNPTVGCGITNMLLDHNPLLWRSRIREQLEMDGQTVDRITITPTAVELEAKYKE